MRPINTVLAIALLCCDNPTRKWQTGDIGHMLSSSIFTAGSLNDDESISYCPHYGEFNCQHNYSETIVHSDLSGNKHQACCKGCEGKPAAMSCCSEITPCQSDVRNDDDQALVCIPTSSYTFNDAGVLAIASCPEQSDAWHRMKCSQRYMDYYYNVDVYDVLPVRDVNTSILYRNVHCAFCNGVGNTEIKFWPLRVDCHQTGNLNIASDSDLLNTIKKAGCYFSFKDTDPLTNIEACTTSVAECNVTGWWKPRVFNYTTQQECLNGQKSLVIAMSGTLYKNSHCHLCNAPQDSGLEEVSPLDTPSFSMLLAFEGNMDAGNVQPSKCASGKVFSHSKEKCINARCSLLRQLHANECKRTVPDPDTFTYRIGFRLTPNSTLSVDMGYDIIPRLGEQLNKFLMSVFPAVDLARVVYELLSVADIEYTDRFVVERLLQANLAFYEVRFKFVNAEPHDPEDKLVELLGLEDEVSLDILVFTDQRASNVSFKLMLKDDLMHFQTTTSMSPCSFRFTNFSSCSDRNTIQNTHETYQPDNLIAVPYKAYDEKFRFNTYRSTFFTTPITDERSILELRKCPFIKVKRETVAWKETGVGIEFVVNNRTVPVKASEYVYDGADMIWMCLETHEQVLRSAMTSFADCPRVDLILNVLLVMFANVACYPMMPREAIHSW